MNAIIYSDNGKLVIQEISETVVSEVLEKLHRTSNQESNQMPRTSKELARISNQSCCSKCGAESKRKTCTKCKSAQIARWKNNNRKITICVDCGGEISYYGRQPKRCKNCLFAAKSKLWKQNNPRRNNPRRNKAIFAPSEDASKDVLKMMLDKGMKNGEIKTKIIKNEIDEVMKNEIVDYYF